MIIIIKSSCLERVRTGDFDFCIGLIIYVAIAWPMID